LLALLELTAARFPARLDTAGQPILLEDQDRRRWDRSAIARGRAALARAAGPNGLGSYGLQAAIAECHDVAPSVAGTDWDRIVLLYEALRRLAPSPVVDLNHAVAVSMASGPGEGLALVDGLAAGGTLAGYHPLHVVRGELLMRLGRTADARGDFLRAAEICTNRAERSVLEGKAAAAADESLTKGLDR
jgi:predicted RNA polymerase sigma factor